MSPLQSCRQYAGIVLFSVTAKRTAPAAWLSLAHESTLQLFCTSNNRHTCGGFKIAGLSGAFRIERRPGGQQISFIPLPKLALIGQSGQAAGAVPFFPCRTGPARGCAPGEPPSCARSRSPSAVFTWLLPHCSPCSWGQDKLHSPRPRSCTAQRLLLVFFGVFWCFLVFFFPLFFSTGYRGNQVQRTSDALQAWPGGRAAFIN